MHMADALLSPAVGGAMWAATAALTINAAHRLKKQQSEAQVPMMAVLGAFVFAAQMINFAIPGTGSSGHLGGGLLLSLLLGPHAAFLTLASVLTVQSLFFADGGLLALGCNVFNLAVFPCYIAYPLIYRPLAGDGASAPRRLAACLVAAVAGLALGAAAVVAETRLSAISELPFATFLWLMIPIHLAIGLVEGGVTAAVFGFVARVRPDILATAGARQGRRRRIAVGFLAAALLTGGVLSWFASEHPDGLEWSVAQITGKQEMDTPDGALHQSLAILQKTLSLMPDYALPKDEATPQTTDRPAVNAEKSLAGMLGALLTLLLAGGIGLALRRFRRAASAH